MPVILKLSPSRIFFTLKKIMNWEEGTFVGYHSSAVHRHTFSVAGWQYMHLSLIEGSAMYKDNPAVLGDK